MNHNFYHIQILYILTRGSIKRKYTVHKICIYITFNKLKAFKFYILIGFFIKTYILLAVLCVLYTK